MHQISLREANQHLSRYVKTVEQGEELVITRRGKPVARLVPVAAQRQLSPEQRRKATGPRFLRDVIPPRRSQDRRAAEGLGKIRCGRISK